METAQLTGFPICYAVGAASQWWSNERMIVYFKLKVVKWACDHTLISPSLTIISPALTSIWPSLDWNKPSFAHLTIIEKLHRLVMSVGLFYDSCPHLHPQEIVVAPLYSWKNRHRTYNKHLGAEFMGVLFPPPSFKILWRRKKKWQDILCKENKKYFFIERDGEEKQKWKYCCIDRMVIWSLHRRIPLWYPK